MSAFVVDDKTINRVVSYLSRGRNIEWIQRILAGQNYDVTTQEGKNKLANDMFQLNINGVDARYGKDQAKEFRPLNFQFQYEDSSPIYAFKSLSCWLYQCSEGDIPEESALYKLMLQIKGLIADHIVCNLPEYDKANCWL